MSENSAHGEAIVALQERVASLEAQLLRIYESLNHIGWQAHQGQAAFEQQHMGGASWLGF